MPKKRRLTRAQRAAISAGLKRYHAQRRQQVRRDFARRSRAAKAGWEKRRALPELRRVQQTKQAAPPKEFLVPPAPIVEEWEVTARYVVKGDKHAGETIDVTMRIMGKPGVTYTRAQIRAAAWYALKHGVSALTDVTVDVVDWMNTRRGGAQQEYHYEGAQRMDEALENARGLFYTVGIGGLRVDPVEQ